MVQIYNMEIKCGKYIHNFDEYLERNVYVNCAEVLHNCLHINYGGYSRKNVYMNCGTDFVRV